MATRWDRVPNLDEDVVRRTSEDVGKVKKRMNVESSGLKGGAKESVRDAGGRAASRLGARAGLAGAALKGGYDLGREVDERTGVGKKIVDATVGKGIDRAVAKRDKVELTDDAKERIRRGDLKEKADEDSPRKMDPELMRIFQRNRNYNDGIRDEREGVFAKGGKVSASSRGDGIAKRGKTKGKVY
jgi:hypothetical protein